MLFRLQLLFLFGALVHSYAVSLFSREDGQLTDGAKEALQGVGVDLSKRHVRPKQKVQMMLAIGDSYTAGIGSGEQYGLTRCARGEDAWPIILRDKNDWNDINDGAKPHLNFGACSGDIMKDVREKQLVQGDRPPDLNHNYMPIDKPQIAVMTISGNDAKFAKIINDCIFRWGWRTHMLSCDQRLAEAEGIVASLEFKKEIMSTYASVIKAGRDAKGSDPPEAFQAFVGGYVGLFNHDDEQCDHVYWNVLRWGSTYKQYLTRTLRQRFNDLVDSLNKVIMEAANELQPFGVFHVDGYNDAFKARRFCEKYEFNCIHWRNLQDPNDENAFWSYQSSKYLRDEGPRNGGPMARNVCHANGNDPWGSSVNEDMVLQNLSAILVPNEQERAKLSDELGPWDVSPGNWDQYEDLYEAILDRGQHDPERARLMGTDLERIFHPKGNAYTYFADKWMETIKANRDDPRPLPPQAAPPSPPPPPPPPPSIDPKPKTKALSILLEQVVWYIPPTEQRWIFFETKYQEAVGCRDEEHASKKATVADNHDASRIDDLTGLYPGPHEVQLKGLWNEDCVYKNDGSNAGRLFCPSSGEAGYECKEEPLKGKDGSFVCLDFIFRHPAITCEW